MAEIAINNAAAAAAPWSGLLRMLQRGVGAPLLLLAVLAMVVLPLPPLALDVLFTFNIALSVLVVMAVVNIARPLDFGIFPTVLLLATLLRLALNVASTRVVLLHGHEGTAAAGHVIEAFGQFVVGGNYAVGIVVFAILTIINFVVVTKGAGRISEVSARFTLDSMPGKQMAIDADLNAGLINQDEARLRRAEVRAEADFYGSMDGASKFVRGDATAGILILIINVVGGLAIGTLSHGLSFTDAARVYTLLTIGDGLVAQIPALLLSTGVAIIVTRMSRAQDLGGELTRQLFRQPRGLGDRRHRARCHGSDTGHAERCVPGVRRCLRCRRLVPAASRPPGRDRDRAAAVPAHGRAVRMPSSANCPGMTCSRWI
jgi:flagellar biosynthesis protein FlhA